MNAAEQAAILLDMSVALKKHGSWAGETHVQKATYLLQNLLGVPVGLNFVLYKHGPFSFEFRDLLGQMEAQRVIALEEQPYPWGPKIVEGTAAQVARRLAAGAAEDQRQIEFVAGELRDSSVSTLERIATALMISLDRSVPLDRQSARLMELKPHVLLEDAKAAFARLAEIRLAAVPCVSGTERPRQRASGAGSF